MLTYQNFAQYINLLFEFAAYPKFNLISVQGISGGYFFVTFFFTLSTLCEIGLGLYNFLRVVLFS